jgi:hypothetical protein
MELLEMLFEEAHVERAASAVAGEAQLDRPRREQRTRVCPSPHDLPSNRLSSEEAKNPRTRLIARFIASPNGLSPLGGAALQALRSRLH